MQFLAVVKLLTSFFTSIPVLDKAIRAIVAAADEAIKAYDDKVEKEKAAAAEQAALNNKDTSQLEDLMGKTK